MHLSFLKELFPQYTVNVYEKNNAEWAEIKNKEFNDIIKVYYDPEDYDGILDKYCMYFATNHVHISEKDELIDCVTSYANAEYAAIEFYENGKNRFGGGIRTDLLDNITYDGLRKHFRYYPYYDISHLTFQVRAWDKKYCFDGMFSKDPSGAVQIIRKNI